MWLSALALLRHATKPFFLRLARDICLSSIPVLLFFSFVALI